MGKDRVTIVTNHRPASPANSALQDKHTIKEEYSDEGLSKQEDRGISK